MVVLLLGLWLLLGCDNFAMFIGIVSVRVGLCPFYETTFRFFDIE